MADNIKLIKSLVGRRGVVQEPVQHDLFQPFKNNRGVVVYMDLGPLEEESLLRLIASNSVAVMVDLRSRPVFLRPRFDHKRVVSYLYRHKITYVEYTFLNEMNTDVFCSSDYLAPNLRSALKVISVGLTLAIYDDESRSVGWVDHFRRVVSGMPEYMAELNPRVLVGGGWTR